MTTPLRFTIELDELVWDPLWPTQRQDVAAALAIISCHQAVADNGLRLLDDWGEADAETLWFKLPDWVHELSRHYNQRYGDNAPDIMQRVLKVLLPETPSLDEWVVEPADRPPALH